MSTTYTCGTFENVRGNCGKTHTSLSDAVRCSERDSKRSIKQGGYSDREIRVITTSDLGSRPLTSGELQELTDLANDSHYAAWPA